jgi:hypothetical protein
MAAKCFISILSQNAKIIVFATFYPDGPLTLPPFRHIPLWRILGPFLPTPKKPIIL